MTNLCQVLTWCVCCFVLLTRYWEIVSVLRVEFLLKTDSGYPRDAEVTLRVEFLLKTDSKYPRDAGVFFNHDGKPWEFPPL